MAKRKVIAVDGLGHGGQPIPTAVRLGPLLVSGTINGRNRSTGELPGDLASQVENAFDNLEEVLRQAGGSLDDVAKVNVYMRGREGRDVLNAVWTKRFPNPEDRPARHLTPAELPADLEIQLEVMAFLEGSVTNGKLATDSITNDRSEEI